MTREKKKELITASAFLILLAAVLLLAKILFPEPKEQPFILTFSEEKLYHIIKEMPLQERKKMLQAGQKVLYWQQALKMTNENILTEVTGGKLDVKKLAHYPKGDVFDNDTLAGYFYHSHREKEHGHFHIFFGNDKFGGNGLLLDKPYTHIIAISVDHLGNPKSLFTVNQWVTGETWRKADEICNNLPDFAIGHAFPSYAVNQWLTAMVQLFRPQIMELIQKRDDLMAQYSQKKGIKNIYKVKCLEIITESPISIEDQMRIIARTL
ncbi:MAG: hypothetical protein Tsb0015_07040 [Simkaniaceae bacterium]